MTGVPTMSAVNKQVLIVGGGLAGLACAVRLDEAGARPLGLDRQPNASPKRLQGSGHASFRG